MDKKKKLKKKIIIALIPGIFFALILIMLSTGLFSVFSFVGGLIDNAASWVTSIFDDGTTEHKITMSDLSAFDLDKMIEVVDDEDIITEELLDDMAIERDSLRELLTQVKKYNTEFDDSTLQITKHHVWQVRESAGKDKDGKTIYKTVTKEEDVVVPYYVTSEDYEKRYFSEIYWQSVYLAAIEETLTNYGAAISNMQASNSNSGNSQDTELNSIEGNQGSTYDGSNELVQYALQFVGNPYVWGGTSLTNGCDCSGFTMGIYNKFGKSLPHSSSGQQSSGTKVCEGTVDYGKLSPGDILCFNGHVAIYIGNESPFTITDTKGNKVTVPPRAMVHSSHSDAYKSNQKGGGIKVSELSSHKNFICAVHINIDGVTDGATDGASNNDAGSSGKISNYYEANTIGEFVGDWHNTTGAKYPEWAAEEAKYHDIIHRMAEKYNLPPDLIKGLITIESGWVNEATSSAGAAGLTEFVPIGWKAACNALHWNYDLSDRMNPEMSIEACCWLLRTNLAESAINGDIVKALVAYNMGYGGFQKNGLTVNNCKYPVYVLQYMTGLKYNAADFANGKYEGNAGNLYSGIGSISSGGRLTLTPSQIDLLITYFATKYDYSFDVVRDTDPSIVYSLEDCASMPNTGKKTSGSSSDYYEWYEPISSLNEARTPWLDVAYSSGNTPCSYTLRYDRWECMMRSIWHNYNGPWFRTLVEVLPRGKDVGERFDYYKACASKTVEYDPNASNEDVFVSSSTNNDLASGHYEPLANVVSSIEIPTTAGGMSIPLYLQYDSRWGAKMWGTTYKNTIAASGCGITSFAMVSSYLTGLSVYPNVLGDKYGSYHTTNGLSWDFFAKAASDYGFYCKQQTANADAIIAALKLGHPVIVSTTGYGSVTTQEFTKKGHYIVLRGLDDNGNVLVNDPNDSASTKKHYLKGYTAQFIVNECSMSAGNPKPMWEFYK